MVGMIKIKSKTTFIEPENKKGITDIIIIGLLAGIFLALTALVIIKLVNSKKKKVVVTPKEENIKREEITISDKEIAEARAMIAKELEKEQEEHKEV